FHVALSGGSTPAHLYRAWRDLPTDWARVFVYFSDERTVPPDSPESNYGLAARELLSHVAVPPGNVRRLRGE
ncbi:6-phosphogluconolactonase, partial [Deinococcus pimensis]|uniref:6-phosphogluconolactonase n=1 Tax=Deinococcus pimensis TaxID=309888 RepID=UPI001B7FC873